MIYTESIQDPEAAYIESQIDREYLIERVWALIEETDQKRKHGLTENDFRYFENLVSVLERSDLYELADLAGEPATFRQFIRSGDETD